ncbi:MAG: hypothetical protein HYR68_10945 [Burkholderiales bacterium]|nr:hypothetical protein [Burkholderiales bacterium]MBI3730636.1 hypothetical protein [Burkholderiales bacterium]
MRASSTLVKEMRKASYTVHVYNVSFVGSQALADTQAKEVPQLSWLWLSPGLSPSGLRPH